MIIPPVAPTLASAPTFLRHSDNQCCEELFRVQSPTPPFSIGGQLKHAWRLLQTLCVIPGTLDKRPWRTLRHDVRDAPAAKQIPLHSPEHAEHRWPLATERRDERVHCGTSHLVPGLLDVYAYEIFAPCAFLGSSRVGWISIRGAQSVTPGRCEKVRERTHRAQDLCKIVVHDAVAFSVKLGEGRA